MLVNKQLTNPPKEVSLLQSVVYSCPTSLQRGIFCQKRCIIHQINYSQTLSNISGGCPVNTRDLQYRCSLCMADWLNSAGSQHFLTVSAFVYWACKCSPSLDPGWVREVRGRKGELPLYCLFTELHLVLESGTTGPQYRAEWQVQDSGGSHCQEDRGVGWCEEESQHVARWS